MKIRKYLIDERRTKLLLTKGEEIIELQKLNGSWYRIGEREKTKLTRKGVYRLIFDAEYFIDVNTKKPFRVVLNRSLATHYCRIGYIIYDSHLNQYEFMRGTLLRNYTDELVDLPETERYIVEPFQEYIAEEKKEAALLHSKGQKVKPREEPKVVYPIAEALEKVKDKVAVDEPSEGENNDWNDSKIKKITIGATAFIVGSVFGSAIASFWKSKKLDYFNFAS